MFIINPDTDNIRCLEPTDVIAALEQEGLPADIVAKANSFTVQHGPKPNTGYFLITQASYDKLKAAENTQYPVHSVKIVDYDFKSSVTFEKMTITNAANILGTEDGKATVVLVKLEDYRWWMKKFHCNNFKQNFIATNKDFDKPFPYYVKENTVKNDGSYYSETLTYYTVEESLTELLNIFVTQAVHPSFDAAIYDSDVVLADYLHNLEFPTNTILEAICKICESMRISFTVLPNGNIKFIGGPAEWPDTIAAICDTVDFGPQTLPTTVIACIEKQDYQLHDDRCTNNHPDNVYVYNHDVAEVDTSSEEENPNVPDTLSEEAITVPYLIESSYMSNGSELNEILATICERFIYIRKAAPRASYWKGYKNYYENLDFGLEQVVYSNAGRGMVTSVIGKELDQMDLNYRNPPFPVYKPTPHGIWLYQFILTSEWDGGEAQADIYRHEGSDTGYSVTLKDPFFIFEDMGVGDSGWCIEICEQYYAIQAPCGAIDEPSVSSSP